MRSSTLDIKRPTRKIVLEGLAQVLGEALAEAEWKAACLVLGLGPETEPSLLDMHRIASILKSKDGLIGVVGCSLSVRINAYLTLSRHRTGRGG